MKFKLLRRKSDFAGSAPNDAANNEQQQNKEKTLQELLDSLDDGENFHSGVYFCDLIIFRKIYNIEMNNRSKDTKNILVASIVLENEYGNTPDKKITENVNKLLKQILSENLRRGDIVTNYTEAHLLMMLPDTESDDCLAVLERLKAKFDEENEIDNIRLRFGYEAL